VKGFLYAQREMRSARKARRRSGPLLSFFVLSGIIMTMRKAGYSPPECPQNVALPCSLCESGFHLGM